jgi:uncharacterized membrane protein YecN with MAPEG domain
MLTAGVLGLLVVVLGLRVSAARRKFGISLGDGGNPMLQERIRAHGNAVETIPLALILLLLAEQTNGAIWLVIGLAALLVVSRILHPIGIALPAPNAPRLIGIIGTWSVTGGLALMAIVHGIGWR